MRRAALIGAVLVLGGISAGIAVASVSSGGIVKHQVRSFALTGFQEQVLDVGPSGDSPGDTFFFQEELRSLDLTKKLGRYESACVLEDVEPRRNRCTATAFLEGGKVELAGRFVFSETLESFRLAVIGGTARYNNVVGHARVNFGCSACPEGHEGGMLTLNLIPSFERP